MFPVKASVTLDVKKSDGTSAAGFPFIFPLWLVLFLFAGAGAGLYALVMHLKNRR